MGADRRRNAACEGPNIPDAPPNPNPPNTPPGVPKPPSAPPTPTDEPPPKPIDDPPPESDPKPPYTVGERDVPVASRMWWSSRVFSNPGGATPTIRAGTLLTRTLRFSASPPPPSRLTQNRWLTITTGSPPTRSSSSRNSRVQHGPHAEALEEVATDILQAHLCRRGCIGGDRHGVRVHRNSHQRFEHRLLARQMPI